MQASYIVHLLPPFYNNFSKRIVKSPKLFFYDTGLACALLGITSPAQLTLHSSRGPLFETFILNEMIKMRFNKGLRSNLFYWRDVSGHEVDILIDRGGTPIGVELKSGMTVVPEFLKGLTFWQGLTGQDAAYVIYGGDEVQKPNKTIDIIPWNKPELYEKLL